MSEETKTYPPCKGTNCGCTDGRSHSPECVAEYLALLGPLDEETPKPLPPPPEERRDA